MHETANTNVWETCSDPAYAGHHLLCPKLRTVLTKLQSRTEWGPPSTPHPPREQTLTSQSHHQYSLWTLWHWGLWLELPQARKAAETPRLRSAREYGMKGYRNWDFNYFWCSKMQWSMRRTNGDVTEVRFSLRLDTMTGPQTTFAVSIIPVLTSNKH